MPDTQLIIRELKRSMTVLNIIMTLFDGPERYLPAR